MVGQSFSQGGLVNRDNVSQRSFSPHYASCVWGQLAFVRRGTADDGGAPQRAQGQQAGA
jgi:hypothetical protein